MRISLSWLQELVHITIPPDDLAEKLTMSGFEVEEIEDRRTWADGVVVGKILDCQPHPNSSKLQVCQVDVGQDSPLTIICGAANAHSGIYVPVATVGTYLPKIDLKIRPAKLRGILSQGMICSLAELGLAKESAGIHIFPDSGLSVGVDARPLLGLDDVIFDLSSTANRADVLSMVGVAREVSALTGASLNLPEVPDLSPTGDETLLQVRVAEPQSCPFYLGTIVDGITVQPSPEWMQRRLQASGIRPINGVVDITNYVLLEWGQPLHAFDGDALTRLTQSPLPLPLGVRFAQDGEPLKTLDGQNRILRPQNLVITAHDHAIALAGVMGGEETEVHSGTTTIVLEAALFESVAVRRSARAQGLRTEASARYERGVNPVALPIACRRALQLLVELTPGRVVTQGIDRQGSPHDTPDRIIPLRMERIHQILGPVVAGANGDSLHSDAEETAELQATDVESSLCALGCTLQPWDEPFGWMVTIPPHRYRDLEREIDLIEEVARLYGYNRFCDTLPEKTELGYLSLEQTFTRRLRGALLAAGFTEVMNYSLVKSGGDRQIILNNPLFTEYSALRTELLSGLIDSFQYNLEQGNPPLNSFEIGRVFYSDELGLLEGKRVAGILGGDPYRGRWQRGGRDIPMDWFVAKGMLESVLNQIGLLVEYQPDRRDSRLHPGRTASLWWQGERLGIFGQLHPQLRQERGLPDAIYVFELDLEVVMDAMGDEPNLVPKFIPFSTFPALERDIAFFAPVDVTVGDLKRKIVKLGDSLLEGVELFDQYHGESVPNGQRSLAFRLTYRSGDRTLTDGEVDPIHQAIREGLKEHFQVSLRS